MKLKNNSNEERDKKKIQITIKKNEDQTWYKNKKSRDEIEKKIKKVFKTICIRIKRMRA